MSNISLPPVSSMISAQGRPSHSPNTPSSHPLSKSLPPMSLPRQSMPMPMSHLASSPATGFISSAPLAPPAGATIGEVTGTFAAEGTNNFVLALPGYQTLKEDDFVISSDKSVGEGGSALIYRGTLVNPYIARTCGFRDVAIKIYKRTESDQNIKFELAILSGLQNKSRHIMNIVGYTERP